MASRLETLSRQEGAPHGWWVDSGVELAPVSGGVEEQYSRYGPKTRLERGMARPERRLQSMRCTLLGEKEGTR